MENQAVQKHESCTTSAHTHCSLYVQCRAVLQFCSISSFLIWDWLILLCSWSRQGERQTPGWRWWWTLGTMCTTIMFLSTLAFVLRQHFFSRSKTFPKGSREKESPSVESKDTDKWHSLSGHPTQSWVLDVEAVLRSMERQLNSLLEKCPQSKCGNSPVGPPSPLSHSRSRSSQQADP